MRYALFDIEVTQPLRSVPLTPTDNGIAVLLRRRGVPIGFWLQPVERGASITAAALGQQVLAEAGTRIIAEAIRDELIGSIPRLEWPSVTIAICTKDRVESVERLLESLCGATSVLPAGQRPEILVVDNAPSDDQLQQLVAQWPEVRYVCERPPGLNFARNRALREAASELLVFLDDDVVPDRGWLAGLREAWLDNRDAAGFTGQVLPLELETEAQVIFERRGGFRKGFDRIRFGPLCPGNRLYPSAAGMFGTGANMAFKVSVLKALGGFDEALDSGAAVPGGGDLDIFYRLLRAGHLLVYEPRFLVFHEHRRALDALSRQYRRSWGLGVMCFVTKCLKTDPQRRAHLVHFVVFWFVSHARDLARNIAKSLLGRPHIPPAMLAGEIWGGVVGLCGGYARSKRSIAKIRRQVT